MRIAVYNCHDPYIKKLIKLAVNDYCERLFGDKRKLRHLRFSVHLKTELEDKTEGECEVLDYEAMSLPKQFKITLAKVTPPRLLSSLAHEVVHAWQFAHGYVDGDLKKWRGRWVPQSTDYWDEPWEVEAYGREPGLFVRFKKRFELEEYFKTFDFEQQYKPTY